MSQAIEVALLIDDSEPDNYYHKRVLADSGLVKRVVVAHAADEAIELLQRGDVVPNIIFLDINMPRVNGFEFLEQLEELGLRQRIHAIIVMLTTSLNPDDRMRAKKLKVDGFISKPLSEEQLIEVFGMC